MAVLMTAFTPLQALGLLNLADDLLDKQSAPEIDLLLNLNRNGMERVATMARQSGAFRNVWTVPYSAPGRLASIFRLKYPTWKAAITYSAAVVLKTLGYANRRRYFWYLEAFCPGLLQCSYDAIYQPIWSEKDELYDHFAQKKRVERHLIDEGFATWKQFEGSSAPPCDVAHLYKPCLVSAGHSEVKVKPMPPINIGRERLRSWLEGAFSAAEQSRAEQSRAEQSRAEQSRDLLSASIFFDQNFGSGVYRSSHPSEKMVRFWETRKRVLKEASTLAKSVGETLVVRAHPYSSDQEIVDLEAFLGCSIQRSNGCPFEVDLLLGRKAVPRKIFTIASTAGFLIPALLGHSEKQGFELHFYFPYYASVNPEHAVDLDAFKNILRRVEKLGNVQVVLHDSLSS